MSERETKTKKRGQERVRKKKRGKREILVSFLSDFLDIASWVVSAELSLDDYTRASKGAKKTRERNGRDSLKDASRVARFFGFFGSVLVSALLCAALYLRLKSFPLVYVFVAKFGGKKKGAFFTPM